MPSRDQYFDLLNRIETLRERLAELQASQNPSPVVADALSRELAALQQALTAFQLRETPPPDEGLAQMIGLGPDAAHVAGSQFDMVGGTENRETLAESQHEADKYCQAEHHKYTNLEFQSCFVHVKSIVLWGRKCRSQNCGSPGRLN